MESEEVRTFSGLKACKKKIPQEIIKKLPMGHSIEQLIGSLIEFDLIHSTPESRFLIR